MSFCGIQPQLRFGVTQLAPVTPGQEMALPMQCFTMASWVPAGERLELEVAGRSRHHASFGSDPRVTVTTGGARAGMRLPELPGATLHDDVPLRAR
jgi:hypothetical protein